MNKALPKTMEGTKRGLGFLHISDNMPRQSGTIAVAKGPPMPGEPKVQVTPCQKDRKDEACVHTVDTPGTCHNCDMESTSATIANYSDVPVTHHDAGMHADNTHKYETIYDEEAIATDDLAANDEEFVAATLTIYKEENVAVDTLATNYKETTDDTLETYDEEFAIATLAAYDEEIAAVEGEPWGA
jgi:hypothetical protein